jgi:hypothetical protein
METAMNHWIQIELLSDTCFSAGVGFFGEVDTDIEQEENLGLPCIRGRTIKGLMVEECAWILQSLILCNASCRWNEAARSLFGASGSSQKAQLDIGNAFLSQTFRKAVQKDIQNNVLTPHKILRSLTDIRYQTKIDRKTHAPEAHSLRNTRLTPKGLFFYSPIRGAALLNEDEKALLAGCVMAIRRGGIHRNRGWGKLDLRILEPNLNDVTNQWATPLLNPWN